MRLYLFTFSSILFSVLGSYTLFSRVCDSTFEGVRKAPLLAYDRPYDSPVTPSFEDIQRLSMGILGDGIKLVKYKTLTH